MEPRGASEGGRKRRHDEEADMEGELRGAADGGRKRPREGGSDDEADVEMEVAPRRRSRWEDDPEVVMELIREFEAQMNVNRGLAAEEAELDVNILFASERLNAARTRTSDIFHNVPLENYWDPHFINAIENPRGFARGIEKALIDREEAVKIRTTRYLLRKSESMIIGLKKRLEEDEAYIGALTVAAGLSAESVKKISDRLHDGFVDEDLNL